MHYDINLTNFIHQVEYECKRLLNSSNEGRMLQNICVS